MQIYSVSVMAFSMLHPSAPKGGTYVAHLPGLIPAESIEEASEEIKAFALERWPITEMWYGHQAAIEPVTNAFYKAALHALEAGIIDETKAEQPQVFRFDV